MRKAHLGFLVVCAILIILVLQFDLTSQKQLPEREPTITQGLYGTLTIISGDGMPSPDAGSALKKSGESRAISFRRQITMYDAVSENISLTKQIMSDDDGFFEVELDPGTYIISLEDGEIIDLCNNSFRPSFYEGFCLITIGSGIVKYNLGVDNSLW